MKKVLALILAVTMCIGMAVGLAGCGKENEPAGSDAQGERIALKVGAILIGDETETYSLAHIEGLAQAAEELKAEGIDVELVYKKKITDENVPTNANDLVADGCQIVICNSYGHQTNLQPVVEANPDVKFMVATGDLAAASGLKNYVNAYNFAAEARYVAGVAAGKKLEALIADGTLSKEKTPTAFDKDGNIKLGYVGAFSYAEVVNGYTSFFLGVKSVVPNVAMTVKYTNCWGDNERDAAVAEYLLGLGCVIISQHSDSTGAATAVQKAHDAGKTCFIVGYNGSLLGVAPDVALTSAINKWNVYYKYFLGAVAKGEEVATDWAKGYVDDSVGITELGSACAAGTQEAVDAAIAEIKGGMKVFDCSKFTVGGKNLTTYTEAWGMNGAECIKTEDGVTYFADQILRSAPYFDVRIDGISEEASDYE